MPGPEKMPPAGLTPAAVVRFSGEPWAGIEKPARAAALIVRACGVISNSPMTAGVRPVTATGSASN